MSEDKPWFKKWPKDVAKSLDYPNIPLFKFMDDTVEHYPDNEFLILDSGSFTQVIKYTYKEVGEMSDKFAAFLKSKGLGPGDRVALDLPNFPEFVIGFYGILKAGCTVVMLNFQYAALEIKHHLKDSGAKAVVTADLPDPPLYNTLNEVRTDTNVELVVVLSIKPIIPKIKSVLGSLLGKIPKLKEGDYYWRDVMANYDAKDRPKITIDNPKEEVATIIYTGGTTGTPKGALLTHHNLVANILQCNEILKPRPRPGKEIFIGSLPFYHSYGMTTAMNMAVSIAAKVILMVNPREDNFNKILELVQNYKVTYFNAVPTLYSRLLANPNLTKYDLSSLSAAISGAAPLPVAIWEEFTKLTGANLAEGYGLTETSPVITANPLAPDELKKPGSIGIPVPDAEVKIVDIETGTKELPLGEVGEIALHGPQVMKGYWFNGKFSDEETGKVMRVLSGKRFFLSGDIGRIDEDGYTFITDRKKDMIILSGFKAYPRDIEEVLFKHPAVEIAAVIGIPDPKGVKGEVVKAFVKLKEGHTATEEELIEFCKDKLDYRKVPTFLEIRDEIPLTQVGKVLRLVLKEEEAKKAKQ
ncbi:MAG: long-chain-fatty-acid--CoA ligase [Candidatus Hodarchaeales archaeon]